MKSLESNKFLMALQNLGQKIAQNNFMSALQGAMMSIMGVIMIGAICSIVCTIGTMFGWLQSGSAAYNAIYMPYHFTMDMISVWLVFRLSYNYAKNLGLNAPIMKAIDAVIGFVLIAAPISFDQYGSMSTSITYLGAQGMFVGFLVTWAAVGIEKWCIDKNISIKLPDTVPSFLQDGFNSILPLLFIVIVLQSISVLVNSATGGAYTICSGFMTLLGKPLNALVSVPGMFILNFIATLFWCFGIHGSMIMLSILYPMMIQAASNNAAAFQAGGKGALVFYPVALFTALQCCGGTGNTFALALMGARSKSKQISSVCKLSIVPGWFMVNEPLVFGLPIMYNPILCIPYILNVQVVTLLYYLGYKTGFLGIAYIPLMSSLPLGISSFFTTLNWHNLLWDYLMLIPTGLIYYPFFKVYEKHCVEQERAEQLELEKQNS